MSDDLMTKPVFEIEGALGTCQLFREEGGFSLWFEDCEGNKPEKVSDYKTFIGTVDGAFEDAKCFVGLEDATHLNGKSIMTWHEFYEACENGE